MSSLYGSEVGKAMELARQWRKLAGVNVLAHAERVTPLVESVVGNIQDLKTSSRAGSTAGTPRGSASPSPFNDTNISLSPIKFR